MAVSPRISNSPRARGSASAPCAQDSFLTCAPYVKDVVIAGHDRDDVTALIFADKEACACLTSPVGVVSSSDAIRAKFQSLLASFAASGEGSSQRVERAILIEEPPSLDAGEITDKGSINQRAVLRNRAALVRDLYASPLPAHVIAIRESISSHAREELNRNKLS